MNQTKLIDFKREKIRKQVKILIENHSAYKHLPIEKVEEIVDELYNNQYGDEVVILSIRKKETL